MPQPWPTVSAVQTMVTSALRPCRRGRERAGHRRAREPALVRPLEPGAIEDALPGRQPAQVDAGGEVRRGGRGRAGDAADVGERRGRRILDDEARRPVGAAPDDGAIAIDVAGGDAERRRRPVAIGADDRRRLARRQRRAQPGERAGARERRAGGAAEEIAAGRAHRPAAADRVLAVMADPPRSPASGSRARVNSRGRRADAAAPPSVSPDRAWRGAC